MQNEEQTETAVQERLLEVQGLEKLRRRESEVFALEGERDCM